MDQADRKSLTDNVSVCCKRNQWKTPGREGWIAPFFPPLFTLSLSLSLNNYFFLFACVCFSIFFFLFLNNQLSHYSHHFILSSCLTVYLPPFLYIYTHNTSLASLLSVHLCPFNFNLSPFFSYINRHIQ